MDFGNDMHQQLQVITATNESNENYKQLYEKEKTIRYQLEQDCDLLAVENLRLQNEVQELNLKLSLATPVTNKMEVPNKCDSSNGNDNINLCQIEMPDMLLNLPCIPSITIKNACNQKNVLSVCLCNNNQCIIACGADNSINVYKDLDTIIMNGSNSQSYEGKPCWTHKLNAPVTSMSSFKCLTLCGTFDGSIAVIDFSDTDSPKVGVIKDHSSRILACVISPDGSLVATSSSDKTINIYQTRDDKNISSNSINWRLIKSVTLRFELTPESIVFAPASATAAASALVHSQHAVAAADDMQIEFNSLNASSDGDGDGKDLTNVIQATSDMTISSSTLSSSSPSAAAIAAASSSSSWELIIGLRNSSSLIYHNCLTNSQVSVSLNERQWDTHASFTPLSLVLSPDNDYLAIATDKNYHIVYKLGTNERVAFLAEHSCGEFGKPVLTWDSTSKYIYSNTEASFEILLYSVRIGKVIKRLQNGHKGSVRSLFYFLHGNSSNEELVNAPSKGFMLSCSFDKSIILWS